MHKTAFSRYTNPINIWEMKSMFDFIKAVRETAASRTGAAAARRIRPELIHLKFEIDRTKCAIDAARNHFEQAVDPGGLILLASSHIKHHKIKPKDCEDNNMSTWYERGVFYHMYPLGMTGAPRHNDATEVTNRCAELLQWILHIRSLGCNAIYIGPLFESTSHGYDTRDYKLVDRRLGG